MYIYTHTHYIERDLYLPIPIYLEILVQVNVPDTQQGQMNQNVSLENRVIYCRAMQGDRWLKCQKNPQIPKGF